LVTEERSFNILQGNIDMSICQRSLLFLFVFSLGGMTLWAEDVSVDDFLAPTQGGPTTIKQPEKVVVNQKTDEVTAASAQDAINAAVIENKKEIKEAKGSNDDKPEVGTSLIRFGSGMGVVATGAASYRDVANKTLSRISQRQAAIVAFTQAKKNMAQYLNGLSNNGKDEIRQQLANVETEDDSLSNLETSSDTNIQQCVDYMLRGFKVYSILDDIESKHVYVTIVTTPKTRGELARPASNQIEVDSIREGIQQVLNEVRNGLVPPLGGHVITVRATGETAFIGFGSSVLRANESPAIQAQFKLSCQRIATAYAQDSLCGLIVGDRLVWEGGVRERYKDKHVEFAKLAEGDPLAPNVNGRQKLAKVRDEVVATLETTDVYKSARQGLLPPGITVKSWFNKDKTWGHAMAVYLPSSTNLAAGIRDKVNATKIIQDIKTGGEEKTVTTKKPTKVQPPLKKLPSGKVGKDDDL
jgi:hypothetical protein